MKQNANNKTKIVVYTIFILLLGVLLAYGIMYKFPAIFQETITRVEKDVTVTDEGIADAVEKVYGSVVIVSTYKGNNLYASGSGFVYKEEKGKFYIITNHHVIADGDNFKVTYTDGKEAEVRLLGGDKYADIAILQGDAKDGVEAVPIGKTAALRVGDTTFTIGAPLDYAYSWTVTRGIISGKERLVEVAINNGNENDYIMNVLQTDAAVNSGNSGGPLCNSNGEVIGVISAKISSTGVEGMGFAIPIETVVEKAEQIIYGEITDYPYLGVGYANVETARTQWNWDYFKYLQKYDKNTGVLITSVDSDSAASKAGLKVGDIITHINGTEINNVAYFRYELYKNKVGDTIKITYVRDGSTKNTNVKLTAKS